MNTPNQLRKAFHSHRTTVYMVSAVCLLAAFGMQPAESQSVQADRLDPEVMSKDLEFVPDELVEGVWERTDGTTRYLWAARDGVWAVKSFDTETGRMRNHWGGTYTFTDDVYTEYVEYGHKKYTFVYEISLADDLLTAVGIGSSNSATKHWRRFGSEEQKPKVDLTSILKSIAIIEVDTKSGTKFGSGFIAEIDGRKYLITNQHVLHCFESIHIKTLDNEQFVPVAFEVSQRLDLVRLEITNDIPALKIQPATSAIGDGITVYGNSAGGGVATEIKGEVLGVGPDLVEVSAEFVEGNSGCPILTEDAQVLGVASFATEYKDPENWISKDTRYQEIRRFGIRLNSPEWVRIKPSRFVEESRYISDMEQAVVMYAVTYVAFRNYCSQSVFFYVYLYGVRFRSTPRGFEEEYEQWKKVFDTFKELKPEEHGFYSGKLYRQCADYYDKAYEKFFNYADVDLAHKGQLLINLESIKQLEHLRKSLKRHRFVSGHMKDRADELIQICDYVLELHSR